MTCLTLCEWRGSCAETNMYDFIPISYSVSAHDSQTPQYAPGEFNIASHSGCRGKLWMPHVSIPCNVRCAPNWSHPVSGWTSARRPTLCLGVGWVEPHLYTPSACSSVAPHDAEAGCRGELKQTNRYINKNIAHFVHKSKTFISIYI